MSTLSFAKYGLFIYTQQPVIDAIRLRNKKRYDSELPYQRPDLIEVMENEIDWTTSTNVHISFYKSVRECHDF